jgi:Ca-activated chloride channel homolog
MFGFKDISAFYFVWPWAFLLLGLIPLGWAVYLKHQRQRLQKMAYQFSYTSVLEHIRHQPAVWKRLFVPIIVSLLAVCMIAALARPTVIAKVAVNSVDMMLVLDISLSMMAEDIRPDRLEAAKEAAIRFVESLPRDARVGLEVFAGNSYVLSPPTSRHEEIVAYLRNLRREDLKPRTEIGSALHEALRILKQDADQEANASDEQPKNESTQKQDDSKAQEQPQNQPQKPDRVIILLSDGDSHEGYPWDQAARDALRDNVVIHTIGVGSPEGGVIEYQGMELPVTFNETTLRHIAEIAHGNYFRVFKESDFRNVYEQIHARTIHYEERDVDLAFLSAGFAFLLLGCALTLALFI